MDPKKQRGRPKAFGLQCKTLRDDKLSPFELKNQNGQTKFAERSEMTKSSGRPKIKMIELNTQTQQKPKEEVTEKKVNKSTKANKPIDGKEIKEVKKVKEVKEVKEIKEVKKEKLNKVKKDASMTISRKGKIYYISDEDSDLYTFSDYE